MEVSWRILDPSHLEVVLAHELTHVVLPHSCRPLAEGIADLAMKEIFPGRPPPLQPRGFEAKEPWSVAEILRFNWRGQGTQAKKVFAEIRNDGLRGKTRMLMLGAYAFGDEFVKLIDTRWGRDRLFTYYRATNRDPAKFDVLAVTAQQLQPLEELEPLWQDHWQHCCTP